MKTSSDHKYGCCSTEKQRLVEELKKCDLKADYKSYHQCYRDTARESGQRARACMIS